MVSTYNTGKPKEQWWDGYLWPYDLLLAFATVILRLRDTKKVPGASEMSLSAQFLGFTIWITEVILCGFAGLWLVFYLPRSP